MPRFEFGDPDSIVGTARPPHRGIGNTARNINSDDSAPRHSQHYLMGGVHQSQTGLADTRDQVPNLLGAGDKLHRLRQLTGQFEEPVLDQAMPTVARAGAKDDTA